MICVCLNVPDLDQEVAVPSGASSGRDCSDRPDGSHVEDGAAGDRGVSGAVPAEDGEVPLRPHHNTLCPHVALNPTSSLSTPPGGKAVVRL